MKCQNVLIVDDDVVFTNELRELTNESYEVTYCSGLIKAIEEIQDPNNNFDVAIIDLYFDLEDESHSEGYYGWMLIPLIYEHHPNCVITFSSGTAFHNETLSIAHFAYRVANICNKLNNPVTRSLSKITSRGLVELPEKVKSKLKNFEERNYNSERLTRKIGLRYMDAVILELSIAIESDLNISTDTTFKYWNHLKTGKNYKNKENPFVTNEYRMRRLSEIRNFIVKHNFMDSETARNSSLRELKSTLVRENALITFENMVLFNRKKNDEKWLIYTAQGKTTGRAGREVKCMELLGVSQKTLYNYIEKLHTELFGAIQNQSIIPNRIEMAKKICSELNLNY